jgi:F-type H+-transporting ATPase subunit delta
MSELARRYASALYGLFPDAERFAGAARAIDECAPLREAMEDPAVDWREKERVLTRLPLFSDTPELLNFYRLLVRKGRMKLLPGIVEAFKMLDLEAHNTAVCEMRCVRVPDESRQEKIRAALCRLHHRDAVLLKITTDPGLFGGFLLKIDGVTYDHSVRGRLRDLTWQLQERRMI